MTTSQPPAAFITGLFETHLRVASLELSMEFYESILGLELAMREQVRRVAFYWVGGHGKTVLGLWEKPPWASEKNTDNQTISQHFAFEISVADLANAVASVKHRGIKLRNFFDEITDIPSTSWNSSPSFLEKRSLRLVLCHWTSGTDCMNHLISHLIDPRLPDIVHGRIAG